jgi:hypothetical protein
MLGISVCGDLAAPLVDSQTSWVYPGTLVQSLYISCYVFSNKLTSAVAVVLAPSTVVSPTGCTLCKVHCTPVHCHSPRWLQQVQVALFLYLFRHVHEIFISFCSVLYTGYNF